MSDYSNDIRGLHHVAYRCRDSEETRHFYEDILGLRLATVLELSQTKTGRSLKVLHTFFEMHDNSFIAFFEVPEGQKESMFEEKSDFDLHLALNVDDMDTLLAYKEKLEAAGCPVRGPSDHGFLQSIYFNDPNGYVVELTTATGSYDDFMGEHQKSSHAALERWQQSK